MGLSGQGHLPLAGHGEEFPRQLLCVVMLRFLMHSYLWSWLNYSWLGLCIWKWLPEML